MQKEKNMKSKLSKIILGASISFGVVSVVTVASAAFVVTGGNTDGSVTPSVDVGGVTDKRLSMTVKLSESNKTLKLDAKSGDNSGSWQWDSVNAEDLTVAVDITVTGDPDLWTGITVEATGGLITGQYITLETTTISKGSPSNTGAGAVNSLTDQTITFNWGEKFGSQNPTEYFDGSSWSSGIDDAKGLLSSMSSVAKADPLTLTFTLTSAA